MSKDILKEILFGQKKLAMKKTVFMWCGALILILVCTLHAASQVKEEFDDLVFYIPNGLSVNKTENALLLSDSLPANGQNFTITINKSVLSLKKIEKRGSQGQAHMAKQGAADPVTCV